MAELVNTTTLREAADIADVLQENYPYGCLLFGKRRPATADLVCIVREAMAAVNAKKLQFEEFRDALHSRLSAKQMEMAYSELANDESFCAIILQIDDRVFREKMVTKYFKRLVVHTFEGFDEKALVYRAVVGAIGDVAITVAATGTPQFNAGANIFSNALIFSVFAAVETYRWCKGEIDGGVLLRNVGEHATGTGASAFGGYQGAAAGAFAGSVFPVIGTTVGGVIGALLGGFVCDAAGRWVYRKILPRYTVENEDVVELESQRLSQREIAQQASAVLKIDIDKLDYSEAKARYRKKLVETHPDKFPNATAEDRDQRKAELRDVIACWNIVRRYYDDKNRINSASNAMEAYVCIKVLKEYRDNAWRAVKSWFGEDLEGDCPLDPERERIEETLIYL